MFDHGKSTRANSCSGSVNGKNLLETNWRSSQYFKMLVSVSQESLVQPTCLPIEIELN